MRSETFSGGKNVYGVPLGVLMLQSRFPRIPGDVGNASTWPFPVLYRVVEGASPERVVRRLGDGALLEPFTVAPRELELAGTSLVTTTAASRSSSRAVRPVADGVEAASSFRYFQRQIQEQLGVRQVRRSRCRSRGLAGRVGG